MQLITTGQHSQHTVTLSQRTLHALLMRDNRVLLNSYISPQLCVGLACHFTETARSVINIHTRCCHRSVLQLTAVKLRVFINCCIRHHQASLMTVRTSPCSYHIVSFCACIYRLGLCERPLCTGSSVSDYVQMAVVMSAKCAQYVEILRQRSTKTSRIPEVAP